MQISVFVPDGVANWLDTKSTDEGMSRSLFVRRIILRAFDLDNPRTGKPPTFDRLVHAQLDKESAADREMLAKHVRIDPGARTLPLPFPKKKSAKKKSTKKGGRK